MSNTTLNIFDVANVQDLTPEILLSTLSTDSEFGDRAAEITKAYFSSSDHGFDHAITVAIRWERIIILAPTVWQLAKMQAEEEEKARKILVLASIFHDMARFCGAHFYTHEREGADLVKRIFVGSDLEKTLYEIIVHHDYFCSVVNGCPMPTESYSPLAEIFRLADKTSLSPADEIRRYHQTGQRTIPDMPVYDPGISDINRFGVFYSDKISPAMSVFNLSSSETDRKDGLSWFLILFALQPKNFVYTEISRVYSQWAKGKKNAVDVIKELCQSKEGDGGSIIHANQACKVIVRFCERFDLAMPS